MKNYVLMGLFLSLFTACAGGGGQGTNVTQNQFVEEAKLEITDASRFDVGCKVPGTYYGETVLRIDERLIAGRSNQSVMWAKDEKGEARRVMYQASVTESAKGSVEIAHKILSADGITLQNVKTESSTFCEEKERTILCHSQPFLLALSKELNDITANCKINLNKERESSLSKGRYYFADGNSVVAFKQNDKFPGQVECNGKILEDGEHFKETIYSNEVPALLFAYASCGGEKVVEKTTLIGKSGKVYWVKSNEIVTNK
jgi:hypothetical protein